MLDWTDYFSSKAKVKVLETICRHASPLPLRHVAYLAELPIYSVQCALTDLHKKRVLLRTQRKRSVLYTLNANHTDAPFLLSLFQFIEKRLLARRTTSYTRSAQNALAFAAEAREIYVSRKKKE